VRRSKPSPRDPVSMLIAKTSRVQSVVLRRPTEDELVVGVGGPLEVTFQLTGDAVGFDGRA